MCFDEGILQAYLDGETTGEENKQIEEHLKTCSWCSEVLKELKENNNFMQLHLTSYQKQLERLEYVPEAYDVEQITKKGVFTLLKKYKKLTSAAAAVACLGMLLSFAPVRSFASQFLTLFRVQKIETTAISFDDIYKIEQAFYRENVNLDIENLGTVENERMGEHREVSWEDAVKEFDFKLKKPTYLPENLNLEPGFALEPANSVDFTLNVKNVNAVIQQLGGEHLLPESLDGKTFSLNISQGLQATAHYEDGDTYKSISFVQTRSPEIKVPGDINILEVREAILDLPVIPEDVRQKLAALDDWQNTLYVPQFENGTTEEININGAQGVLIKESRSNKSESAVLMWQNKGVLYILNGYNIASEELIKVANSIE